MERWSPAMQNVVSPRAVWARGGVFLGMYMQKFMTPLLHDSITL